MTIRTDDGLHIAFHEAALVDYAGMNLQSAGNGVFRAALTPSATGPSVVREGPFETPWRTLQIADTATGLANSNLILNLNAPNVLGDVSWVRPCRYVGIWWGMHLGIQSWASGPIHGATTENARKMIDFAAANGFCGVLIEGWNQGWDGDWFANGEDFSFTKPYPDFDLPKVAAHARKNGVKIIGHHETSGNIAHYESQMAAGFALYQRLSIDAVKTGYVADAGGLKIKGPDGRIAFEWHEGQASSRHHLKVVTEAAKHRIAINPMNRSRTPAYGAPTPIGSAAKARAAWSSTPGAPGRAATPATAPNMSRRWRSRGCSPARWTIRRGSSA